MDENFSVHIQGSDESLHADTVHISVYVPLNTGLLSNLEVGVGLLAKTFPLLVHVKNNCHTAVTNCPTSTCTNIASGCLAGTCSLPTFRHPLATSGATKFQIKGVNVPIRPAPKSESCTMATPAFSPTPSTEKSQDLCLSALVLRRHLETTRDFHNAC